MSPAFLTADEILNGSEVPFEIVPVPFFKKDVIVVGMTGEQRDDFEASLVTGRGRRSKVSTANVRAKLVAYCVRVPIIDGDRVTPGARMFTDEQVARLGQVRADVLDPIFAVAQRLSGITEADVEELGK